MHGAPGSGLLLARVPRRLSGERRRLIALRVIGWLLIVAALFALGWDIFLWIHDGHFALTPAGKLWYQLSSRSFNFAERVIADHIWKPLWFSGVMTVLSLPTLLVAGVPGVLLAVVGRRRKRRRFGR